MTVATASLPRPPSLSPGRDGASRQERFWPVPLKFTIRAAGARLTKSPWASRRDPRRILSIPHCTSFPLRTTPPCRWTWTAMAAWTRLKSLTREIPCSSMAASRLVPPLLQTIRCRSTKSLAISAPITRDEHLPFAPRISGDPAITLQWAQRSRQRCI